MAELRLAATGLLGLLFLAILSLLLVTLLLCFAFALATAGAGFRHDEPATWAGAIGTRARIGLSAAVGLGALAMGQATMRLTLAEPATLAGHRIQLLSAWPLTRGRLAVITYGNLLAAAPVAGVAMLSASLRAAEPAAVAVSLVAFWLPFQVGLMAYFFQALPAPDR